MNPILADASVVLIASLKDGTGRFDASDLMPAAVGSGSFWTGMVDYMKGGPDSLKGVLDDHREELADVLASQLEERRMWLLR